jgi:hypothetical protein
LSFGIQPAQQTAAFCLRQLRRQLLKNVPTGVVVLNGSNQFGDTGYVITLATNIVGAVMETTTNLSPLVVWTPIWTNAGVTNISFPIVYQQQFFRLRE